MSNLKTVLAATARRGRVRALLLCTLVCIPSGCLRATAPAAVDTLRVEGWQVLVVTDAEGAAAPPGDQVPALPEERWRTPAALDERHPSEVVTVWSRVTLDNAPPTPSALVVRSYAPSFAVYLDGRRIYRWPRGSGTDADQRLAVHVIRLPAGVSGTRVQVWTPSVHSYFYPFGSWVLTPMSRLPVTLREYLSAPLWSDLDDLVIAGLSLMAGLMAAVAAALRRNRLLAAFAAFAALYGMRLVVTSHPLFLLGATPLVAFRISSAITYAINVPSAAFVVDALGLPSRVQRLVIGAVLAFAVTGIAADQVSGRPFAAATANNILVLSVVAALAAFLWLRGRPRRSNRRELRILLAGTAGFLVLALNENLVGLGLVPWSWSYEPLGFLAFCVALGWVAGERFVANERRLLSLDSELQTARRIQESILPDSSPECPGLAVAARYVPMSEIGGDLYDYAADRAAGISILVADVSGHGIPAALIASMVKMGYTTLRTHVRAPAVLLGEMNRMLARRLDREFVTAACVWADPSSGSLTIARAGHPPPLLRRRCGRVEELMPPGPLLGHFPRAAFDEITTPFEVGDRLLLYTDGITEARAGDEEFGVHRLERLLAASDGTTGGEFADQLAQLVTDWSSPTPAADDLTIVVVDAVARPDATVLEATPIHPGPTA